MIYDPYPFRRCWQCGNEYPKTIQHFTRNRSKSFGLEFQCKSCVKAYNLRYQQNNREKVNAYNRKSYRKHAPARNAKAKEWTKNNHEKRIAISRRSYRNHQQKRIQEARVYKATHPPDPLKERERSKRRYRANPQRDKMRWERWSERNRDRVKVLDRINAHKRRTIKRGLPHAFTETDWQQCLNYWRGCCAFCGNPPGLLPGMELCADHWIPLASPDCPGTIPENIVPLCKTCNSSKKDRDPVEWLTEKLGKRKARRKLAEIAAYFAWLKGQK